MFQSLDREEVPNASRNSNFPERIGDVSLLRTIGVAGAKTRKALIEAYMALEGTTLPKGIGTAIHGCGEFFPEDKTGDGVEDPENRRVEIFCFDDEIVPPVPGRKARKGELEYELWKHQVTRDVDVGTEVPGELGVHVFDDDSFEPIVEAGVWVFSQDDVQVARGITDTKGIVVFADLLAGDYRITAAKEDRAVVTKVATVVAGKRVDVKTLGDETADALDDRKRSAAAGTNAKGAQAKASPTGTVAVGLPGLSGIYFDPASQKDMTADEFAKHMAPIFSELQKLTRDSLEALKRKFAIPGGDPSKPPATRDLTQVRIANVDDNATSLDAGTHLIRDLSSKRADCSKTLVTPRDQPLVEIRTDIHTTVGETLPPSSNSDSAVRVILQTNDFSAFRSKSGVIDPFSKVFPDSAFWVTRASIRIADGKSPATRKDDDLAMSLTTEAEPELISIQNVLAHELVHAWRQIYTSVQATSGKKSGSVVYTGVRKKRFELVERLEELKTVGLCDPHPSLLNGSKPNDPRIPTENRIRADRSRPSRAAYNPIDDCPFREGVQAQVKIGSVRVVDPGSLSGEKSWSMSASVVVKPPNPGLHNGGEEPNAVDNRLARVGFELGPLPNQFKCDLLTPEQSIVATLAGLCRNDSQETASINAVAAATLPYRVPAVAPGAELPERTPPSRSVTIPSPTGPEKGGAFTVTYQINLVGNVDSWGNIWAVRPAPEP